MDDAIVSERFERRIDVLAQSKPLHFNFEQQRRSLYWIDRVPFTTGPNGTTQIVASQRVRELANPRSISAGYKKNRLTAVWPVRPSALTREPTERLIMLSEPKHQFAIPDRSVFSSIPRGLPREPTLDRLLVLSQPRDKEDRFSINETQWGQSIPISFAAIIANPSSRIEDLARPKKYHPEFKEERPIQSMVKETTLASTTSPHLKKLSRPLARAMIIDNYDPYKVSSAAQRSKPTARTAVLSAPLGRKQRQKNVIQI